MEGNAGFIGGNVICQPERLTAFCTLLNFLQLPEPSPGLGDASHHRCVHSTEDIHSDPDDMVDDVTPCPALLIYRKLYISIRKRKVKN